MVRRIPVAPPLLALVLLAASCGHAGSREDPPPLPAARRVRAPARPASCTRVPAGQALQPWVDRAPDGGALCLEEGRFRGPVVVARRLTIWGPRRAVVGSGGAGTTIRVTANGSALAGFTVDGSGARYDEQDAAVAVRADRVRVEGLRVVNATFGILSDRSDRLTIRGNEVEGNPNKAKGLRGDGIRLWETRGSKVEDNLVRNSRDLVVWYSSHNHIARNRVEGGRYGTHLMYSHYNVVEDNDLVGNSVGVFVMYSHGIRLEDNRFLGSHRAGGMGVGLKDAGDVFLLGNWFVRDATGLYVDSSPMTPGQRDVVRGNAFRLCDAAVVFHGDAAGNELRANSFVANRDDVRVEDGGDAKAAVWEGNHYDDYAGFDLDGDGTGDVPYEVRRMSSHLAGGTPSLAFFRGTVAFGVLDVLGKVVPLFAPRTLLVDPRPRMADPLREPSSAH